MYLLTPFVSIVYMYLSESYDKPIVMNIVRVGGGGTFSYVECGWLNKPVDTVQGGPVDKRAHHNALERRRRDHIKDSFHGLRDSIPSLHGEKVLHRLPYFSGETFVCNFLRIWWLGC